MGKQLIALLKKSWSKPALKLLALVVLMVAADQTGGLLWMFDRSLQRVGQYSHHVSSDVQVRVSPKLCAFFSNAPTGVAMRALTLGRTIFVPDAELAAMPSERLSHELGHVEQWEQRGLLGFAVTYSFWQVVAGYERNPLENFN